MKISALLQNATRAVGKMALAVLFLVVAVGVGFGGTALLVFHEFSTGHAATARSSSAGTERNGSAKIGHMESSVAPALRQIAALPSDISHYTYADNRDGQPSVPPKRQRTSSMIPRPLEPEIASEPPVAAKLLNDPESRYIVDPQSGRVIGIDGSAGAAREQAEEITNAPEAIAVQTPPPEVRTASPVIEDGRPVYHLAEPRTVSAPGSQYVPIRKAIAVTDDETEAVAAPRTFNVGEYLAANDDRPVLRAQPVVPADARW